MKLTNRQEAFIKQLFEMYHEAQEPIHYPELAERLGVNRFTAYDMLRVLEEKGVVSSEYRLSEEGKSGRSERLFFPTELARQIVVEIAGEDPDFNWEEVKQRMLTMMAEGKGDAFNIGPELIARIPPETDDKFQYAFEVVTVLALQARKYKDILIKIRQLAQGIISEDEISPRAFLSLFAGFAFGIMARDIHQDEEWLREMLVPVVQYLEIVNGFSEEEARQMGEGIEDHFQDMLNLFPEDFPET